MDYRLWSNRLIAAFTVAAAAVGLYLTVAAGAELFLAARAGAATFLTWALTRELDPDHEVTALAAGLVAGAWVLTGLPFALLATLALLLGARLLLNSTGRRPLPIDMAFSALAATAASTSRFGFLAGFGLAVALYVDTRLTPDPSRRQTMAALGTAVATAAVASVTGVFPQATPELDPVMALAVGAVALIAVAREPAHPVSFVDHRSKAFMRKDRLHAARAATGTLLVLGVLVSGEGALVAAPLAAALAMALATAELDRIRRPVV